MDGCNCAEIETEKRLDRMLLSRKIRSMKPQVASPNDVFQVLEAIEELGYVIIPEEYHKALIAKRGAFDELK